MPKRGRSSDQLTGGTGDVNPQWFVMVSSANFLTTFATTTVPTPINKFPEASGRVVIMEVLKAFIEIGGTVIATAAGTPYTNDIFVMTRNPATTSPSLQDGSIIAHTRIWTDATSADTGRIMGIFPIELDLTDGAGHGMLVATDNLYLGIIGTSATIPFTGTVTVRLMYRFKKVSLQEYIGIVQSQQSQ